MEAKLATDRGIGNLYEDKCREEFIALINCIQTNGEGQCDSAFHTLHDCSSQQREVIRRKYQRAMNAAKSLGIPVAGKDA